MAPLGPVWTGWDALGLEVRWAHTEFRVGASKSPWDPGRAVPVLSEIRMVAGYGD